MRLLHALMLFHEPLAALVVPATFQTAGDRLDYGLCRFVHAITIVLVSINHFSGYNVVTM